ncbi:MAG: DUF5333 domain-containing protein [Pseudomonadota bacterium]
MMIRPLALALAMIATPAIADARVALKDHKPIERGLVIVAIGDALRKNCTSISPRFLRAYGYARGLYNQARALGYSDSEIDAYLDSETDKARVREKARAYLVSKGVKMQEPASYCAVGRTEIERNSQIGVLLREN